MMPSSSTGSRLFAYAYLTVFLCVLLQSYCSAAFSWQSYQPTWPWQSTFTATYRPHPVYWSCASWLL